MNAEEAKALIYSLFSNSRKNKSLVIKYFAMDINREIHGFSCKPTFSKERGKWQMRFKDQGKALFLGWGKQPKKWGETLYEIGVQNET